MRGLSGLEPATRMESWSVRSSRGLGAGDERRLAVVLVQRRGELGDGGGDRRRDVPRVPGERQVGPAHGDAQLDQASTVDGLAGDDGDAELLLQAGNADVEPGLRGEVHHVQHEDDRTAEVEDLVDQVEVPLEVGRVDDAEDAVGLRGVAAPAEQHVARDGLVGRARGERIRAGQVDDRDGLAVLGVGRADLFLDGDPGIISDLLLQAGEGVEERALAAVGIAHQRIGGRARRRGRGGRGKMGGHRHLRGGFQRGRGRRRPCGSRGDSLAAKSRAGRPAGRCARV